MFKLVVSILLFLMPLVASAQFYLIEPESGVIKSQIARPTGWNDMTAIEWIGGDWYYVGYEDGSMLIAYNVELVKLDFEKQAVYTVKTAANNIGSFRIPTGLAHTTIGVLMVYHENTFPAATSKARLYTHGGFTALNRQYYSQTYSSEEDQWHGACIIGDHWYVLVTSADIPNPPIEHYKITPEPNLRLVRSVDLPEQMSGVACNTLDHGVWTIGTDSSLLYRFNANLVHEFVSPAVGTQISDITIVGERNLMMGSVIGEGDIVGVN